MQRLYIFTCFCFDQVSVSTVHHVAVSSLPFKILRWLIEFASRQNKADFSNYLRRRHYWFATPLDWSKCLFCQEDTGKKLLCPADYADRFKGAASYKSIAKTLQAFHDLGCLLDNVKLARTDYGDGLEQTSHEGKQNSTQHAVSNSTKMNFNVLRNGR